MNDDFNLEFKDKEIDKLTSDINRENRRQFGRTFKSAAESAERTQESGDTIPSGEMPAGALETVMPRSEEEIREQMAPISPVNSPVNSARKIEAPNIDIQTNSAPTQAAESDIRISTETPDISNTADAADDHSEHVAPILSPSANADEEQRELYAVAKPLRTYERDIADAIREKNASVASINLAAQKKREETGEKKVSVRNAEQASRAGLIILVSILLILASVSFAAIAYYFFSINRPPEILPVSSAVITTDASVTANVTDMSSNAAITAVTNILANKGNPNSLIHVAIIENIERTEEGKVETIPASISIAKFFELFARSAPPALIRALGPEWMFGFQTLAATGANAASTSASGTNEPFIFIKVSSFDNAWSGMLGWENDMLKNLAPLLPNPEVANTNADRKFQDVIIRNKDVRVLRDSFGNVLLMYSFLDANNLVITSSEQTFREILGRFFSSQIVR